jgi:acylpyruvate hydrolase
MIWAIGINYRDHAAETGKEIPIVPTVFAKSPGSVIASGEDIVIPPHVLQPDYEGEVAVVIGRRTRDIAVEDAIDAIGGITVAHDVSARDHQYVTSQYTWSKSFDTFCPLGPIVVPVAGLDVHALTVETRLNGDVVQSSDTSQLVFSIPEIIAHLAQGTTLEPGDVILTGTPSGVGMGRTPPRWLQNGDLVEITVGGVGTLTNRVVRR